MFKPVQLVSLITLIAFLSASCGQEEAELRNERSHQPNASQNATATKQILAPDSGDTSTPDITGIEIPANWPDELDDTCYKADSFLCLIEYTIMQETNAHRGASEQLQHKYQMSYTARKWSDMQRTDGRISHTGFPDGRILIMIEEFATTGTIQMWAENVAVAWSDSTDPIEIGKMITKLWWESPLHKQNMLGDYTTVGVGVIKSGNNYWATQIFGVGY